jgi:PAS domain S-box-containing protein
MQTETAKRNPQSKLLFLITLAVLLIGLYIIEQYNFLLAHAFAEVFSIAVAWVIFFISWNARDYFDDGFFVFLGIAFLCVGAVDLVHTVAYKGMGFFPEHSANLPTELWIFARYLQSVSFLAAFFYIGRQASFRWIFFAYIAATAIGLMTIFTGLFPDCYIQGEGLTVFKKVSEYIISAIIAVVMVLIYVYRGKVNKEVRPYLYGALGLTIAAEMAFTTYVSVYGFSNLLGHFFKVVSFYLIYRGVVVMGIRNPYMFLVNSLQERNRELEASREELGRAQKITSTMLDNLPEEITLLDKETLTIMDVNRTFLQSYGLRKEEVVGRTCYEVTHGLSVPCNEADHPCPIFEGQDTSGQVIHKHTGKNGEEKYFEIGVWPVKNGEGETGQLVHISRDITEQKRVEEMRENVERVVRHDLKTPLNGIIGGVQILQQDENLTDEQQQTLDAIYQSGQSMLSMVNNSLRLYQMAEGNYTLDAEMFNIVPLLERLSRLWDNIRSSKRVELSFSLDGRPLDDSRKYFIYGEQQTLESLFANLIENALQASPENNRVTVKIQKQSETVQIDIHNQGTIPEEIRDRFFERYTTSGKQRGTGLGTYSAWLITRAHAGRIWFATSEEEGTHVFVELPLET